MKENSMSNDALEVLFESLLLGDSSQAILNQEKRGQMQQSRAETLPRKMLGQTTREHFEALGFVFGENVDDLFVSVVFPSGWKKVPTEHSMHTDLVDGLGRKRGGIFYKAAFYDRNAHVSLGCRYSCGTAPVNGYGENYSREDPTVGYVADNGVRIWETDPVDIPRGGYEIEDALRERAREWIEEHYPNHNDLLAYWDTED